MTLSICLIASDPQTNKVLRGVLARTGLTVWTSESEEAFERKAACPDTLCLVIAIPGLSGLELLERLRARGVETSAILVGDPAAPLPAKRLFEACALDAIYTPVQTRELLGWIECLCVTRMILSQELLLQGQTRRRHDAEHRLRFVA